MQNLFVLTFIKRQVLNPLLRLINTSATLCSTNMSHRTQTSCSAILFLSRIDVKVRVSYVSLDLPYITTLCFKHGFKVIKYFLFLPLSNFQSFNQFLLQRFIFFYFLSSTHYLIPLLFKPLFVLLSK